MCSSADTVNIRQGTPREAASDAILSLLKKGLYKPTPDKVAAYIANMTEDTGKFFAAEKDGAPVGLMVLRKKEPTVYEITLIYVEPDLRGSGVGRKLFYAFAAKGETIKVMAETDDEAVGFYTSLGFRIASLGEKYPAGHDWISLADEYGSDRSEDDPS